MDKSIRGGGPATKALKRFAITDPYCPAAGTTSLNDTPFIVKLVESSEELPAGCEYEPCSILRLVGATRM